MGIQQKGYRMAQALRKSHALGPSVRILLAKHGLDQSKIVSTGPNQILLKGDVLAYLNQKGSTNSREQQEGARNSPVNQTSAKISHVSHGINQLGSRYSRNYPSQLEIDVINSGGAMMF